MLPNIANVDDLVLNFEETERRKTQTYRIIPDNSESTPAILGELILGKSKLNITRINKSTYGISGRVNGLTALQQNILLMLSTEADQYIIYPYTYGINTLDLIGKPSYYVMAVLPERIKKTLLSDDRILDVTDFEFETNRNKLGVKFIVHSIYGDLKEETAVIY